MTAVLKCVLRLMSTLAVLPACVLYSVQAACFGRDHAITGWSQIFSLLPGTTGVYLRHAFFRQALQRCDADAWIGFGSILSHAEVSIGRTVYIGNYCSIGNVAIEDDVLIASHVSIMNGCRQHRTDRLDVAIREQAGDFPHVTIGRGTWIGERATIAASVGSHCVIGAGSLVLSPIPDFSIAVGAPAKVIGDRRDRHPANQNCAAET